MLFLKHSVLCKKNLSKTLRYRNFGSDSEYMFEPRRSSHVIKCPIFSVNGLVSKNLIKGC